MADILKRHKSRQYIVQQNNLYNCVEFTKQFELYLRNQPEKSGYLTHFGVMSEMVPFAYSMSKIHHVDCNEFKNFTSSLNSDVSKKMRITSSNSYVNYLDVNVDIKKDVVEYKLSYYRGYDSGGC